MYTFYVNYDNSTEYELFIGKALKSEEDGQIVTVEMPIVFMTEDEAMEGMKRLVSMNPEIKGITIQEIVFTSVTKEKP